MMQLVNSDNLKKIADKVLAGERLSFEDGVTLFHSDDLLAIGYLADIVRQRINGQRAYFIHNRHINYTNICKNRCRFCAFSKDKEEEGAFTLTLDEILQKAGSDSARGVSEFHIVAGLHPDLPFSYYLDMIRELNKKFPQVHIQAFTAVEIAHLADIAALSVAETLGQLKEVGLGSLPGGGAEVFSPRVRELLCPEKLSGKDWLAVAGQAHKLGLRSNATMLYGHIETIEERVDHLLQLRVQQDETGGFLSFIPLAFHPQNTDLSSLSRTSGSEDLKVLAISRLLLDNFPHIKAFWIMIGIKLAQVSLSFGVDDIDGTVVEEKITHSAGAQTAQALSKKELVRLIQEAGKMPIERDTVYNAIKEY